MYVATGGSMFLAIYTQGRPISWENAKKLIQENYKVPEDIKRDRRRRKTLGNSSKKPSRRRREMVTA